MLNIIKKFCLLILSTLITIFLTQKWILIKYDFFYGAPGISLDNHLFLSLICIIVNLLLVVSLNKIETQNNTVLTTCTRFAECMGLASVAVIIFNLFVDFNFYSNSLNFVDLNLTLTFQFEYLISLVVICSIRGLYYLLIKKIIKKEVLSFAQVSLYIAIFACVLISPASAQTYENAQTANEYVYRDFGDGETYNKYKEFYENHYGYNLREIIDNKTVLVEDIRHGNASVERFDSATECNNFIISETIQISDLPYSSKTRKFDDENCAVTFLGEYDLEIISDSSIQSLKKQLPIASAVALATFMIYLFFLLVLSKKMKKETAE